MGQGQHHSKANKRLTVLAIAMFVLFVNVYEIFTVKICITVTFRMDQDQTYIHQSKANKRLPLLAIEINALSVIVCVKGHVY